MARPKIEKLYKYACGCYYKKPRRNTSRNSYYPCPVHKKPLVCKVLKCDNCGEWVERPLKNSRFRFCDPCKVKLGIYIEPSRAKAENSALAPARKQDCKHYNDCLSGKLDKNPRACQGCKKYVCQPLDVADYIDNHRCSDWTLHSTYPGGPA